MHYMPTAGVYYGFTSYINAIFQVLTGSMYITAVIIIVDGTYNIST